MAEASEAQAGYDPRSYPAGVNRNQATGWVGWLLFAAIMLVLQGSFQAILGFVSLFNDGFFLVHHNGRLIPIDYTTWGWVHIILAAVAIATGIGLMLGQLWARILGVVVAFVNTFVAFAFISAYPWWTTMLIVISVITMYAIIVHGHEIAEAYDY